MNTHNNLHTVGQRHGQFLLTKAVEIPELQCTLRELLHEPTGASVMHIANKDPENLFCLSFQTLPSSSNGVAHILEHTVLCGSKKFPVKDPFFAMTRRSLNTFMNAFTGSDFTCYPAASQVPQDFYNLLDVYLDAVFHPNLKQFSFLQEGHRLEFTTATDPKTALQYKGIVFNEMKGSLSSANARMNEAMSASLFPDLPYGYNSGGDPKDIPELTYEEMIAFHKKFYHPSRCLFFFYGNMPLEKHLDFIEENALKDVEKVPQLKPIPPQPRFSKPQNKELTYPISSEESTKEKTMISFGWLTCHILEQEELLALSVLETILMDTDASPLKMALLKSGWCTQASSYMDEDISEIPFIINLRGCEAHNADNLENLILSTLEDLVKKGVEIQMFENAIHQLEIDRSEITGDQFPFGLSLFMRSALLKQHGGNPEDGLVIHSLFERLRKKNLENPHYLTGLISKHLLNNTHRVRIVLTPDKELAGKELEQEREALEKIRSKLTKDAEEKIIKQTIDLAAFQKEQEEEDFDILPKLTLDHVPKHSRYYQLNHEKLGSLEVFSHHCFTNDILYADLIFDIPKIAEEDLSYLRLFTTLLSQVGCNGRNYQENLEYIQGNTGGIGAALTFNLQTDNKIPFVPSLHIRGKSIYRKASKLFTLFEELIDTLDFTDLARLKELILKQFTGLESSLNQHALKYAINLSASCLDSASSIANYWYGLNYFWKIKELAENFDKMATAIVGKMIEFKDRLLGLEGAHLVITCDSALYDDLKHQKFYGLQDFETKSFNPWKADYPINKIAPKGSISGKVISSPVAFIAKVLKTIPYCNPDSPALNIASFLLDNLTLHPLIREQGGAYGGGASCNAMSANFYFYSYRDPNISSTLQAFEKAVKVLIAGDFDESDLEEAKLEMIQGMDAPVAPGSRGSLAYGWWREGKTQEMRQAYRIKLLNLKKEDIMHAVKIHIAPALDQGTAVVFAGKELLDRESQILKEKGIPLNLL